MSHDLDAARKRGQRMRKARSDRRERAHFAPIAKLWRNA